jgi:hypothetical protein
LLEYSKMLSLHLHSIYRYNILFSGLSLLREFSPVEYATPHSPTASSAFSSRSLPSPCSEFSRCRCSAPDHHPKEPYFCYLDIQLDAVDFARSALIGCYRSKYALTGLARCHQNLSGEDLNISHHSFVINSGSSCIVAIALSHIQLISHYDWWTKKLVKHKALRETASVARRVLIPSTTHQTCCEQL